MKEIFFPSEVPAFTKLGNVSRHPQFRHLQFPPPGIRITQGRGSLNTQLLLTTLFTRLKEMRGLQNSHGVTAWDIARFIYTRGRVRPFASLGSSQVSLLPTFPRTIGNEPWMIEIEDVTTLFWPFRRNGRLYAQPVKQESFFPLIAQLLDSPNCHGILTHMKSTAEGVGKIFGPQVADKTAYFPVPYISDPAFEQTPGLSYQSGQPIRFFFNNSWHQDPYNFIVRGGPVILDVFQRALAEGMNVELILRTRLPKKIRQQWQEILAHPKVQVVDWFMSREEYMKLFLSCHVFLLPAARLHVVSVLEAMYYGKLVIASDGWGMEEFITDQKTGLLARGIHGLVSGVDPVSGELIEDYRPFFQQPHPLRDSLWQKLRQVVTTPELIESIGKKSSEYVKSQHSLEVCNSVLASVLRTWLC